MSLFGATNKKSTFQKAKERMDKLLSETSAAGTNESSHIGELIKHREGPLPTDPDGTAMTTKIAREELGDYLGGPVVLPRNVFNNTVRMQNDEAREKGHPSHLVSTVHSGSSMDEEGNLVYKQLRVYTIPSDGSELSSVPATSYGGSEISFLTHTPGDVQSPRPTTDYSLISFPSQTPQQLTEYERSIAGFPPSAAPQDPFETPRASGQSILVKRYIQLEENVSMHAAMEEEEKEGGVPNTLRRSGTPTFENSDGDDAMTEVEWRDEEVYLTPTKKGKKRNKRKGVKRPVTPERPIPNMPQTPSRR